jgi:membrane-bound ClpP family serine protease
VETQLRPTGKAIFKGKLLEVTCEDGVMEKGRSIRITEVTGNKILVEPVSNTNQEKGE